MYWRKRIVVVSAILLLLFSISQITAACGPILTDKVDENMYAFCTYQEAVVALNGSEERLHTNSETPVQVLGFNLLTKAKSSEPDILTFLILYLILIGIGIFMSFLVHKKYSMYFKY